MSDPIRAAIERLHQYAEIFPVHDTYAILAAARAALAEQQGEGPSDEEIDDQFYAHCYTDDFGNELMESAHFRKGARALLARWGHQSTPPAEGEVGELVEWLQSMRELAGEHNPEEQRRYDRTAELLQQQHPTPVPVAELPGPEDCDGEGRCWWGAPALFGTCTGDIPHSWRLCRPDDRFNSELVWLPATALPLPQGEVE